MQSHTLNLCTKTREIMFLYAVKVRVVTYLLLQSVCVINIISTFQYMHTVHLTKRTKETFVMFSTGYVVLRAS